VYLYVVRVVYVSGGVYGLHVARNATPPGQISDNTSVLMKLRAPRLLSWDETELLTGDRPSLSLINLRAFLSRVLCFTKTIGEIGVIVNDKRLFRVTKSERGARALSKTWLPQIDRFFQVQAVIASVLTLHLTMDQALPPVPQSSEPFAPRRGATAAQTSTHTLQFHSYQAEVAVDKSVCLHDHH
jgi:hypothetical protein